MPSEQLQALIQAMRARPQAENATLEEQRAGFEATASAFPLGDDVRRNAVDAGGVPAEWLNASDRDGGPVLCHFHGGGYVIGSVATHRQMNAHLSRAAGGPVLAVGYRLAPEHPFPAAVDDATAAYRWLLSTGVDPARAVIVGDSAGGGLAMAALIVLRDAGDPLPAAAVCISPWADLECAAESMATNADADPILSRDRILEWARAYLGDADPRDPLASPIHGDLSGLPPLLIQVGTSEVLLDDATRLAERARAAGVEVTLEPWDDVVHIWHVFAAMLPEAREAIERIGAWVRERVA